jgi:hypothetical protein
MAEGLGVHRRAAIWAPRVFLSHSNRRVAALVQLRPPKPPPRPAGGSHCLGYHLGRAGAGGWQGPPLGPIALARQAALPRSALRNPGPGGHTVGRGRGWRGPGYFFCESPFIYTLEGTETGLRGPPGQGQGQRHVSQRGSPQFPGVLVGPPPPPRSQVPSNVMKRAHPTRLGRPLGP